MVNVPPKPLDGVDRLMMVGDEIIQTEKNIEFVRRHGKRFEVKDDAVDDGVDVVAPVIDLGNMALAQGIINSQNMKAERVA